MTFTPCAYLSGILCPYASGPISCPPARQKLMQRIGYVPNDCPHFEGMAQVEAYPIPDENPREAA
jgi:hypothetical protein